MQQWKALARDNQKCEIVDPGITHTFEWPRKSGHKNRKMLLALPNKYLCLRSQESTTPSRTISTTNLGLRFVGAILLEFVSRMDGLHQKRVFSCSASYGRG